MSNTEAPNQRLQDIVDYGTLGLGAAVAVPAALHEIDALGLGTIPLVEHLPGIDHASSAAGSYALAAGVVLAAGHVAARLEGRGHEQAADLARRAGKILAWTGSLAAQLVIETNVHTGVGDKWDVVAGLLATLPGIIAGRAISPGHSKPYTKDLEQQLAALDAEEQHELQGNIIDL